MFVLEQEFSVVVVEEVGIVLEQVEQGMQVWQQQWDVFNQQSVEFCCQVEVQQLCIQYLEQSLECLQDCEWCLQEECGQLVVDFEDVVIFEFNEQVVIVELVLEEL